MRAAGSPRRRTGECGARTSSGQPQARGDASVANVDPARIEEATLNALQTQQQLFYDGWLLRFSPGKAKRARSVNPHFGSSLPLIEKIAHCEALYAARALPALFRITPFSRPADLETALERRGYVAFDRTLVQVVRLPDGTAPLHGGADVELVAAPIASFVETAGVLRGSTPEQRAAHLERLAHTPLATHAVVAAIDGRAVACGQVAVERDLAAIYDMVTAIDMRGRGVATRIVQALLAWAREQRAAPAFLQVNDDNGPALAVYRKFGFATAYTYHYRARPKECR
jgi:ribosomal protein S18 acetylase RimI-like enzyme